MLRDRTDRAWFSRLVRHPARKRSGSILTAPEPTRGHMVVTSETLGKQTVTEFKTQWGLCITMDRLCISNKLCAWQHNMSPTFSSPVGAQAPQKPGDLWPFDLESGVRVTCDVGYLCANFSLHGPLCSLVRPNVCDKQTDVRQKHRLMPPHIRGRA